MTSAYIDADVIVRFLTKDDPAKFRAATALFERTERGEVTLHAESTTIADVVYVLTSPRLYRQTRADVHLTLTRLLMLPQFHVSAKDVMLKALALFATSNLDFGDCMTIAAMGLSGIVQVYAYDRDFDRYPQVNRIEP